MISHTTPTTPLDDVSGTPTPALPEADVPVQTAEEFGGRDGPDPARYGDWEKNGRCIDF